MLALLSLGAGLLTQPAGGGTSTRQLSKAAAPEREKRPNHYPFHYASVFSSWAAPRITAIIE
jgi:hypothetical protein